MEKKRIASFLLSLVMLAGYTEAGGMTISKINSQEAVNYKNVSFSDIAVNDGEVIKGVDISSVISLENSGVVFKNKNGEKEDIFLTLKNSGVNYIRVRVWNKPYDSSGKTYGGGANDIETAVKIAERCKKYGLKMLIDFHYSDFWADPGKQVVPKEWKNFNVSQKAQAIKEFTASSLKKISGTGAEIGMVQIGNETTSGMCGETDWKNISALMNSASEAIRQFSKNTLIAVHFTNPEKKDLYSYFAQQLDTYRVDYDVFASSYYPYWHGTLGNLTSVLKNIADKYHKYVMVAETSWVNTFEDTDSFANTISDKNALGSYASYPVSVQGQADSVADVFKAVANVGEKGIGAFYWEPAWITVGNDYAGNNAIWEKYGSGWASTVAGEYQKDAAQYHGGSAVDNQAFFDKNGVPLASLDVFLHIKSSGGNKKKNYLENPDFEKNASEINEPQGWKIINTTSGEYSKFTVNAEMPRSGNYSVHWYSPAAFTASSLSTQTTADESGDYTFIANIAGEKSSYCVHIYINDKEYGNTSGKTSGYDNWIEAAADFYAAKGDKIRAEITVDGQAEAYGSIDDCAMFLVNKKEKEPDPVIGDIDGNGRTDISDYIILKKYMLGISEIENDQLKKADTDKNSMINILDMNLLKEIILK